MKRLIVVLLLLSSLSSCLDKTYSIRCFHELDISQKRIKNVITVDSKNVTCFCGKPPVFVLITFGKVDCYCIEHARLCLHTVHKEDLYDEKN